MQGARIAKCLGIAAGVAFIVPVVVGSALADRASVGVGSASVTLGGINAIPPDYLADYVTAAATCPGLPWEVLAAIGMVESDNGQSNLAGVHSGANAAGAEGPMQFEPATFAEYADPVPPGGETPASPYDPVDAIWAAARDLCANGAQGGGDLSRAIYAYNHAWWYVNEVLAIAASYAGASDSLRQELLDRPAVTTDHALSSCSVFRSDSTSCLEVRRKVQVFAPAAPLAEARAAESFQAQTSRLNREDLLRRATEPLTSLPRPFLKWAGSKRAVAAQIAPHLPTSFGTYWEPFLGGGTMFFLIRPGSARLSDLCAPLVNTYRAVRDDHDKVFVALRRHRVSEADYYKVRACHPRLAHTKAARFIYLNKVCWNGLYRVNLRGEFNVPFGRPRSANMGPHEVFRECAAALAAPDVQLRVADFEAALKDARRNDLIYLDPPYATTGPRRASFLEYNEKIFLWRDQLRLAEIAHDLAGRGCNVYVTNSCADEVARLYRRFQSVHLLRQSTIAAATRSRGLAIETLYYVRNEPDAELVEHINVDD